MNESEVEARRSTSLKLVKISGISIVLMGPWAIYLVWDGGPEALGAIIPLAIIAAVHIVTGPIALFHAFRIRRHHRLLFVYAYFALYLVAPFFMLPPDIVAYTAMFLLLTVVPIAISWIRSWLSGIRD